MTKILKLECEMIFASTFDLLTLKNQLM